MMRNNCAEKRLSGTVSALEQRPAFARLVQDGTGSARRLFHRLVSYKCRWINYWTRPPPSPPWIHRGKGRGGKS